MLISQNYHHTSKTEIIVVASSDKHILMPRHTNKINHTVHHSQDCYSFFNKKIVVQFTKLFLIVLLTSAHLSASNSKQDSAMTEQQWLYKGLQLGVSIALVVQGLFPGDFTNGGWMYTALYRPVQSELLSITPPRLSFDASYTFSNAFCLTIQPDILFYKIAPVTFQHAAPGQVLMGTYEGEKVQMGELTSWHFRIPFGVGISYAAAGAWHESSYGNLTEYSSWAIVGPKYRGKAIFYTGPVFTWFNLNSGIDSLSSYYSGAWSGLTFGVSYGSCFGKIPIGVFIDAGIDVYPHSSRTENSIYGSIPDESIFSRGIPYNGAVRLSLSLSYLFVQTKSNL
jgi:hypothetical protein